MNKMKLHYQRKNLKPEFLDAYRLVTKQILK